MNCKQVDELLPLYAGHDLDDERAGLITAHTQSCVQCALSVREYEATSQLVQQFEPPQFSEATFAAIRRNVLREIEQKSSAPTLLALFQRAFQPRIMWAVSTAVLLVVCAFAYYLVANRTGGPRPNQLAAGPGTAGGAPAPATGSTAPLRNPGPQDGRSPRFGTTPRRTPLNQTAWHSTRAGRPPALPAKAGTPALSAKAGPPAIPGAALTLLTEPNTSATSGKPMRVELQTKDPNIRIIWFSQPSINEGSPIESSKGI